MTKQPPLAARWLKTVVEIGLRAVAPKQVVKTVKETLANAGAGLKAKGYYLVALGKAADAHAAAWMDDLPEALDYRVFGVRGYGQSRTVKRFAGNHPLPGPESFRAGLALHNWLQDWKRDLPAVVLLSGGGSAAVEHPAPGFSPAEITDAAEKLLGLGVDIVTANAVRCQWSALKAGQALERMGNRKVILAIHSDVPPDAETWVSSGLFDPGPFPISGQAREVFNKLFPGKPWHDPNEPTVPLRHNWQGLRILCGNNRQMLDAMTHAIRRDDYSVELYPEGLTGEAADVGARIAALAQRATADVILIGGEPTVTLPERPGRGGRLGRLALGYGLAPWPGPAYPMLAAASDGTDGASRSAGAYWLPGPFDRNAAEAAQATFNSDAFFEPQGRLLKLPVTNANVRDIVIVLRNTAKLKEK